MLQSNIYCFFCAYVSSCNATVVAIVAPVAAAVILIAISPVIFPVVSESRAMRLYTSAVNSTGCRMNLVFIFMGGGVKFYFIYGNPILIVQTFLCVGDIRGC